MCVHYLDLEDDNECDDTNIVKLPEKGKNQEISLGVAFLVIPLGYFTSLCPKLESAKNMFEPSPTLLFESGGNKESNSFGVAFFVIPLGVAHSRNSRTLTLSLL